MLASEIERLPDLTGYLKHASDPDWQQVRLEATRRWDQHRSAGTPGVDRSRTVGVTRTHGGLTRE